MGTLSKTQIAEKDATRPENCPNFGTGRTCGKAYDKGCRVEPCLSIGKDKEKAREAKRTGVRVKATTKKLDLSTGFSSRDDSSSKNWSFHDTCCGARVWRPRGWRCLPALRAVSES